MDDGISDGNGQTRKALHCPHRMNSRPWQKCFWQQPKSLTSWVAKFDPGNWTPLYVSASNSTAFSRRAAFMADGCVTDWLSKWPGSVARLREEDESGERFVLSSTRRSKTTMISA